MINLKTVIEHTNLRFSKELEKVTESSDKKVDEARLARRNNEQYFTRLGKACLGVSQNINITDEVLSLVVSTPEILFSKIYQIGWGKSRKQEKDDNDNKLLAEYFTTFSDSFDFFEAEKVISNIKEEKYLHSLICHGLSPTSDTLLLLADMGRSLRISRAAGIMNTKILLADVSWIKYNRSINQLFDSPRKFLKELRVCLDIRERLYKAMKIEYKVFGISDFDNDENNLKKSEIVKHVQTFRELATLLWGEKSLEKQSSEYQALIGKSLGQIPNKYYHILPETISKLISLKEKEVAYALEDSLESELKILRTVSELFSSFDEEIFIYYFAQYFAQMHFENYLKIAPISEIKFDQPFLTHSEHFAKVTKSKKTKQNTNHGYIYCPQYQLGDLQLLPYTSISGDVLKKGLKIEDFSLNTILIDDYSENIEHICKILKITPTVHRNRLISDLLSFIHFLYQVISEKDKERFDTILNVIDPAIWKQIKSVNDTPREYFSIFSEWFKAIELEKAVMPFHIIPYLWEDADWDELRIKNTSSLICELTLCITKMCD